MKEIPMENGTQSNHTTKPQQHTGNHAERFGLQTETEGYGSGSRARYSATAKALWSAMEADTIGPADLSDDRMEQLALPIINATSSKDRN
jgi:hypothetical protein